MCPLAGPFVFCSPSVVADEDPVRPTQQRSCQLAGSSRSERVNPTLSASQKRVKKVGEEVRRSLRSTETLLI